MQELISKEDLKKIFDNHLIRLSAHFWTYKELIKVRDDINSLPTTVHHEYKVGELVERFKPNTKEWEVCKFLWYRIFQWWDAFSVDKIRPIQSEHPDITQARELASKHWMILIPKE